MSGFDAESYASFWRKQNEAEKKRIGKRAKEAIREAKRIAVSLVQEAGVEKVVLFGSLAENSVRDEKFDIDLAVWGGDWRIAQGIGEKSPFKIDIVEYDYLPPHLKKRIDKRGRTLS
ncbi:MAG: nucleotidyltransferase domain-containing protein [Spirochaetales bacterium]|jgi:predicted nucleotidyltransferase|nr:nucleotidyltransferase domain-containing protein [Spirochaetales bacterium]